MVMFGWSGKNPSPSVGCSLHQLFSLICSARIVDSILSRFMIPLSLFLLYHLKHFYMLGTAIVIGKKGHRVWTDGNDAKWLSKGVYNTYTAQNLRYSQVSDHVQSINSIKLM